MILCKRIYDHADDGDGHRILVDRLWPRGVSLERAAIDEWLRVIAPSNELRRWFGHAPARWGEFQRRYKHELACEEACKEIRRLQQMSLTSTVTLLTATRDIARSHSCVLRAVLNGE